MLEYLNEWPGHSPAAQTITLGKENFIRTCHENRVAEFWYRFVTIRVGNTTGVAICNPLWWPEKCLNFL